MKRILALILLACMALTLVACGGSAEKEYTLSVAVDSSFSNSKQTNVACAVVFDKDGKIVKAVFDSFDATFGYNNGELVAVENVATKVEKGESYGSMPAGTWYKQADAFAAAIVGKTAAEVEALDDSLIAGCTMKTTTPVFKTVVKKAADYSRKVSFKAAGEIALGFDIEASISGSATEAKVSVDYAALVFEGGKIASAMLDSSENKYALTVDGEGDSAKFVATDSGYKGTKNEQGDAYKMPAGTWYAQAQAFANSTVGKTAAELSSLETVSDALAAAGCTMKNTTEGYKVAFIAAAAKVK